MSAGAIPVPTLRQAIAFEFTAACLRLRRFGADAFRGRPGRIRFGDSLEEAPLLAECRLPLWPVEEVDPNFVIGKIQNLRVARIRLDGIEAAAGEVFSFWRQVGRAASWRGFVIGRELREGCLVPAIGGGLCLLSNAIYDCALRAGLQIIERHPHTRALPGSLAEHDRDATVFWNYVDLRLSASFPWRLEVAMDAYSLCVRIHGVRSDAAVAIPLTHRAITDIEDCASCGRTDCHRHSFFKPVATRRLWWLEESWPEFVQHLSRSRRDGDIVFGDADHPLPARSGLHRLAQSVRWRYGLTRGRPLPQLRLAELSRAAMQLQRCLQPGDLDLVAPQSLLPFLWQAGALAGRRYQVLMTALPMSEIQAVLNDAVSRHPTCPSLKDFRAPTELVRAERDALENADALLSPHAMVHSLFGNKVKLLDWSLPQPVPRASDDKQNLRRVFFPASALARKGIFELIEAARGLPVEILLPPGDTEPGLQSPALRRVESYRAGLQQADVVALPAWIEHQPRGLLAAISSGIPVIATSNCGLPAHGSRHRVQAGDVDELRAALISILQ